MSDLISIGAAWPIAASLAMVITAQGLRAGRRRTALNAALHELRRPLQAIVLATDQGPVGAGHVESSAQLAAAALERLDCEINGGAPRGTREELSAQPLVEAAVGRWKARANLIGDSLTMRWRAGRAVVDGDRSELSQALDNLIVNAIEHGGPSIAVEAQVQSGRLRVSVTDSGRAARPESREETPADVIARLAGRRRHGHGLAVVRRIVAAHEGRLVLRCSDSGSVAVLELPLASSGAGLAA
ncbi:MAG: ATP-binding protein [Solirubrobacterales bacterium]